VRGSTHRPHPYHVSLWFPFFFFQLAELTLFFFAACRSRHIAGTGHANEDIRDLLIIGDSNPFKSGGRTPSSTVAWYRSTIVCLPIPRTLGISVGLYGSQEPLSPVSRFVYISRPQHSPTSLMVSHWCVLRKRTGPKVTDQVSHSRAQKFACRHPASDAQITRGIQVDRETVIAQPVSISGSNSYHLHISPSICWDHFSMTGRGDGGLGICAWISLLASAT